MKRGIEKHKRRVLSSCLWKKGEFPGFCVNGGAGTRTNLMFYNFTGVPSGFTPYPYPHKSDPTSLVLAQQVGAGIKYRGM